MGTALIIGITVGIIATIVVVITAIRYNTDIKEYISPEEKRLKTKERVAIITCIILIQVTKESVPESFELCAMLGSFILFVPPLHFYFKKEWQKLNDKK